MKKQIFILVQALAFISMYAQVPQKMSYQAVIRDSDDNLVTNTEIGMRVTILEGSVGIEVYQEIFDPNPVTNDNGLVTLEIGSGTPTIGSFEDINWENGHISIKTETDPTGGTNYTITGQSQLLSVPYALYSKTTETYSETDPVFTATPASGITSGEISNWNTAYGWGNHSLAGYLTSYSETDPLFNAHPASGITSTLINNWNTAYGWGNHATAGYLTSAWLPTGNSGTISGTNFLGTLDNQALDFRTNNVLRTRITTKGQIETFGTGLSVFIGEDAGDADDLTDNGNVFIGYQSGINNTTGYNNIALGWQAFDHNTSGNLNVAMGLKALSYNTNGEYNVALGYNAMYQALGSYNVCVGMTSGYNGTLTNCTFVGRAVPASGGTYNNSSGFGYYTPISGNNQVHLGNSSVTNIQGQVNWGTYSDLRIKKDVLQNVPGLNFIRELRPITYYYDIEKENQILGCIDTSEWTGKHDIEKIRFSGFIAQEVEEAALKAGYDFSGIDKSSVENGGLYSLRYAEFVVPLVKAVQEQQEMIEQLNKQNEELLKRIEVLEKK
jgi:trimeric autotransporter adhesin